MAVGTHWNPPKEVIWEILFQIESIRSNIQELRQLKPQMNYHQKQSVELCKISDHVVDDDRKEEDVGKPIIFSNSEQESNNRSLLVEKNEDQEEIEDTHQMFDGMPMKNSSISDQDFGVNRESDFGRQDQSMDEILRVESIDFEADRCFSPVFIGEGNNRFFKLDFGVKNEFYSSENKSFAPNEKDELFDMGKLIETEMRMNGSRTISVSHVGKSSVHDMFDEMPSRSFKGSLKREECGLNLMIGSRRNGSKMMLGFEYGSWILGPRVGDTISVFDTGIYRAEIATKIVAQNYRDRLHEFGEMFHVEL